MIYRSRYTVAHHRAPRASGITATTYQVRYSPNFPFLGQQMNLSYSSYLIYLFYSSYLIYLFYSSYLIYLFFKKGSPQQFWHAGGIASTNNCGIFIHNGESAPAGDGFGAVHRSHDSTIIHEVFQDKRYKTAISRQDFDTEYKKVATANVDILI